jgi:hypothetical protein
VVLGFLGIAGSSAGVRSAPETPQAALASGIQGRGRIWGMRYRLHTLLMMTAGSLLALLTLYVLSYGPACDAFVSGELDRNLFAVTYHPITWTCQRSEAASYVMGSYRLMWDRREWATSPVEVPPPPVSRRLLPRWRW